MSRENVGRSFMVFSISLIAPFLVWLILRLVGTSTPVSFDPSPWVQGMVTSPSSISMEDKSTSWVRVVTKDKELYIEKNSQLKPLSEFVETSEKVIFLVQAEGPTLAKKFYDFFKEHNLASHAMVLSASDGFLKDLRYCDANLTLSCGQAYVIRWHALKQLGLHTLMTINMSAVWLDPSLFASSLVDLTKFFTELHVPVFIGPVTADQAKTLPAQANFLIEPLSP
jgi:hypothetical protein